MRTEQEQLRHRIRQRFRRGVTQFGLIEDGDRILVGQSGGKDSLVLLRLLAEQSRIFRPCFSVVAVHVENESGQYLTDNNYLEGYAAQCGVPLLHTSICVEPDPEGRKSTCFLCSWERRKALFRVAREQQCNKIALGHHRDDILQTFLMNLVFEGSTGTMRPKMPMDKFPMTLIRPLALVDECDLERLALLEGFPPQLKRCPWEQASSRARMKALLSHLEQLNPEARQSLWRACMK
ncbi:MAG: tRNA 2-thiocytidine biosynthesis TtcA family protein [Bacteroidaceae bacterium]|nr:tRNA 2-thiocytidine biosynthesis TtcA family protein [Bacteroidaceae bacterium]